MRNIQLSRCYIMTIWRRCGLLFVGVLDMRPADGEILGLYELVPIR